MLQGLKLKPQWAFGDGMGSPSKPCSHYSERAFSFLIKSSCKHASDDGTASSAISFRCGEGGGNRTHMLSADTWNRERIIKEDKGHKERGAVPAAEPISPSSLQTPVKWWKGWCQGCGIYVDNGAARPGIRELDPRVAPAGWSIGRFLGISREVKYGVGSPAGSNLTPLPCPLPVVCHYPYLSYFSMAPYKGRHPGMQHIQPEDPVSLQAVVLLVWVCLLSACLHTSIFEKEAGGYYMSLESD